MGIKFSWDMEEFKDDFGSLTRRDGIISFSILPEKFNIKNIFYALIFLGWIVIQKLLWYE